MNASPTSPRRALPARSLLLLALSSAFATAHAAVPVASDAAAPSGASAAALAEPASDKDKKTVQLGTVEVSGSRLDGYAVPDSTAATKLDLSPRQTPQSMTIVTRQRLDDQDMTSVRKVLDNTTGIYSDQYDTERVLFYSRGFLVDALMVDGVPAAANFNTGSVDETGDTALYDRVEIVRGATGLMTGAGNPAASVNLVRKHADSREATASLDLSLGSWNDRRIEADATTPLNADGSVRARGVAVYEDAESYQALYHKKTAVLYGILDWDVSPATRLSFGFDHQDNRPRGNTWGSFPLFLADNTDPDHPKTVKAHWPRSVTTSTDWAYWNRKTDTVFGELRHAFGNDWTLRAIANWRRYRESEQLFYVYGWPDTVTGEGLEPYADKGRGTIVERALDAYASGPFQAFGHTHELVFGVNASRTHNVGTEYAIADGAIDPDAGTLVQPTGNFFDWDGSYPLPPFVDEAKIADIRTEQDGLYAAARWSLADPLTLITGARHATWKIDSDYAYDDPQVSRYDYRETIPYAGLVWDFSPSYSAFASYTGIFKPQNARDVNGHYLDPMKGRSMEAGIKGEHMDGRLTTALTVFDTRQDNVAAAALDAAGHAILLPDGSQASRAVDGTHARGFEAEVAGRLGEQWQASFGWSRTLMHDGTGAAFNTYIPSTLVRSFATYTPAALDGALVLGGGVNWQSATRTLVASPEGEATLRQPSVLLLSLMARYRFSPNASLQLNANNLLDRRYYVLDQYDNTYFGAPANATLSLHLQF